MEQPSPQTIEDYIQAYPTEIRVVLRQILQVIRQAAPDAQETIKYQIPTLTQQGNLVSFAAYNRHIGVYPVPAGDKAFKDEIGAYRSGKSTARFPLDKPIPYDLIGRLVMFRVQENEEKAAMRKK